MSSSNNDEAIGLDSLPDAKQQEFFRLCNLVRSVETDEEARIVTELLKASPEFARVVGDDNETLLHRACFNRVCMLEMMQFLVDHFPRALEMVDDFDYLPLHLACSSRSISLDVIEYLVDKYPKALEEEGCRGVLPFHNACGNPACSLDSLQYLIKKYPKALEASDEDGDLPLHYACFSESRSVEVIRYVLEQYLNASIHKNNDGMLPLHWCIQCFKNEQGINFADLLDRMRVLLPGYPGAIDVAPRRNWHSLFTDEDHGLYKEVAGLLLEEISLREQWEWAMRVVQVLSLTNSSIGVDTACSWATEWRDVCRRRLDAIEERLAALENLLVEFRGGGDGDGDDD